MRGPVPIFPTTTIIRNLLLVCLSSILGRNDVMVAADDPSLPFGDINMIVVSDVHSFVGGHPHEPDRNADYGDLYSFHERLKAYCDETKRDLWLLNNGDWLHGTGLAMDGNATSLLPIINGLPWDALNMGNHEATYTAVVEDMRKIMLPAFPGKYLTSNVLWTETMEPFGERYQLMTGPHTKSSTVLVYGFLYNMESPSEKMTVTRVEDAVEEPWFAESLQGLQYNAIIVMAHMDNDDALLDVIYQKIRTLVDAKMPIQFITGHSHKRQYTGKINTDRYVRKIEPGGLFDTVGWVTMPNFDTTQSMSVDEIEAQFQHEFLNSSKAVLAAKVGLVDQPLETAGGKDLSELIKDTQSRLGLDQVVACPGKDYFRDVSIYADNSLWKLWRDHVVPTQIFQKGEDRVMLVSKGAFRYDLRGSGKHDAMTLDDVVAIAPFMERVMYVGRVPDWMVRRMNNTFNTNSHHALVPDYVLVGDLDRVATVGDYDLYTHEVDVPKIVEKLEKFNYQDLDVKRTGKRDTLYWLDYVMAAFPCDGIKEKFDVVPYFYNPNELDEEDSDGNQADNYEGDNIELEDDKGQEGGKHKKKYGRSKETLPPGMDYPGYLPGYGQAQKVPKSKYDNYVPPEEEEKAKQNGGKNHGVNDLKTQLEMRKKKQKSIIKGFALTMAAILLFIPLVCMVLQLTGRLNDDDDDDEMGMYDRKEWKAFRRHRRRHGHRRGDDYDYNGLPVTHIDNRPVGEIEFT